MPKLSKQLAKKKKSKAKTGTKLQKPKEQKKFLEYKRSAPYQLSLFDMLDNEKDFSQM